MPYWELIGLVERCAVEGWWGILTFHGVDQGHLPIVADCLRSAHDLCTLLDHVGLQQSAARMGERAWVRTVVEVAEWVKNQQISCDSVINKS